jgi:hypothetical protein
MIGPRMHQVLLGRHRNTVFVFLTAVICAYCNDDSLVTAVHTVCGRLYLPGAARCV